MFLCKFYRRVICPDTHTLKCTAPCLMFWLHQYSNRHSGIKSQAPPELSRMPHFIFTTRRTHWCHFTEMFLSCTVLNILIKCLVNSALLTCSVIEASWISCIIHLNKEMAQHWIVACSSYPLSKPEWHRICTSKWWYCHVISLITELCTLTQSKWKLASSEIHHVLCRYTSRCGFKFILKADPCGRNFWNCLTQSEPGFFWIGWTEKLQAL